MIILKFEITIRQEGGKTHVEMEPTFKGDTPAEKEALPRLAQEIGQLNNRFQRKILDLCAEKEIKPEQQ